MVKPVGRGVHEEKDCYIGGHYLYRSDFLFFEERSPG